MRRKDEAARLRQVAAIRDLQRRAAESEASRAATALRRKQELCAESEGRRHAAELGWLAALSGPSVRLEMAALWCSAVSRHGEAVQAAARDAESAAGEVKRRATAWHLAEKRYDTARDLAKSAAARCVRSREETALQDAMDLRLQHRGAR